MTRQRVGGGTSWIQTYTGVAFDPLNPDPSKISLEDIAHALSNICRYTGHTCRFYSVAEHSVRVSWLTRRMKVLDLSPEQMEREGLMHDAFEAYLMDLANPIKVQPEFAFYRAAEKKGDLAVDARFGLRRGIDPEVHKAVRLADLQMLSGERTILLGPSPGEWGELPECPAWAVSDPGDFGWTPARAKLRFINAALELGLK